MGVLVAAPHEGEEDAGDAGHEQDGALEVDAVAMALYLQLQHRRGDHEGGQANRDVDEERPAPAQAVDEEAAEQGPGHARGTVGLSALADELDVDLSTMSRQVRALEQSELLARSADPADGRAVVLALTPEGGELLKRMRATRRTLVGEQLDDWSDGDVADLARLLRRLADRFLHPPVEPLPDPDPDADAAH